MDMKTKNERLKHLLLAYALIVCAGYSLHAQVFQQQSCEAAKTLCHAAYDSYDLSGNEQHCTKPLFYYFYQSTATSNSLLFESKGSAGSLTLYRLSGDAPAPDVCSQLDAGMAIIAGAQTFGTYQNISIPFQAAGLYLIRVAHQECYMDATISAVPVPAVAMFLDLADKKSISCPDPAPAGFGCRDCITSFSPAAGKYMLSAWVKEAGATMNTTTYANASIGISFSNEAGTYTFAPSGRIIDGWQRIEGVVDVPAGAADIHLALQTAAGKAYFDDIRFYPLDGSMISYVYDPANLRLMAQLDERNYATFYEYDEEGKLIRIKKETERGIMTIQENRDNIIKQ